MSAQNATLHALDHALVEQRDRDPLLIAADPIAAAREHIVSAAFTDSPVGTVGLELEYHLVDLADPYRRPTWPAVQELLSTLPLMPSGSRITLEPGGQIELSTPPTPDVVSSIAALRADETVLRAALRAYGYGAAAIGADPARPLQRINPAQRYVAMQEHFAAVGCAEPGTAMMSATAALQVNVDAGPRAGWGTRLARIRELGPVLVALSACSPYLAGESSGWQSMRQQAWHGIDHSRSDPVAAGDPAQAWAAYALEAPVMLTRDDPSADNDHATPVTTRVPFADWLAGTAPIARRPTLADLDYHLTTLFPPVRPRGYVEIRCLDALPARWWPAVAALTVTLIDDPDVSAQAAGLVAPVRDARLTAASDGLADPAIRAAVLGCADAALARCPAPLLDEVGAYVELLHGGRTPADQLREVAERRGPLAVLEEEAHA